MWTHIIPCLTAKDIDESTDRVIYGENVIIATRHHVRQTRDERRCKKIFEMVWAISHRFMGTEIDVDRKKVINFTTRGR